MKRFYPQRHELESYAFMSLTIANILVNSSASKHSDMTATDMDVYKKIIEAFGKEILCNSLTTYLSSEYALDPSIIGDVLIKLILIWRNPLFIEVRTRKKCVVAIGIVKQGVKYVVPDDVDMKSMYDYLTK